MRGVARGTGRALRAGVSTVLEPSVILGGMQLEVNEESEDRRAILGGVSWEVYEALLQSRGEKAVPRLTYLDGSLEIMSPGVPHEQIAALIGRLLIAYSEERDFPLQSLRSSTLRRRNKSGGLEPDESFALGEGALVRPDIAIEVNSSRPGLAKLEVYRRMRVPEVWIWYQGKLSIHVLKAGKYRAHSRSALLPDLDLDELLRFVDIHAMSRSVKAYREALRRR